VDECRLVLPGYFNSGTPEAGGSGEGFGPEYGWRTGQGYSVNDYTLIYQFGCGQRDVLYGLANGDGRSYRSYT
jgi:hypothetical protein